jgi:hypothetical protein
MIFKLSSFGLTCDCRFLARASSALTSGGHAGEHEGTVSAVRPLAVAAFVVEAGNYGFLKDA